MRFLPLLLLQVGLVGCSTLHAPHSQPSLISPDRRTEIVQVDHSEGADYLFRDTKTGRTIGKVLEFPSSIRDLSPYWNRSGDAVAVTIRYGTKLSMIEIFRRESGGYSRVEVDLPEAISEAERQRYNASGSIYHEVIGWENETSVQVLNGHHLDLESGIRWWFVKYTVRLDGTPRVEKVTFLPNLSQRAAEPILKLGGD